MRRTGLTEILCGAARWCFAGDPQTPPQKLSGTLSALLDPAHALVVVPVSNGGYKLKVHHWPSWLQSGHRGVVTAFFDLFYPG